jgi:hypothetical protein
MAVEAPAAARLQQVLLGAQVEATLATVVVTVALAVVLYMVVAVVVLVVIRALGVQDQHWRRVQEATAPAAAAVPEEIQVVLDKEEAVVALEFWDLAPTALAAPVELPQVHSGDMAAPAAVAVPAAAMVLWAMEDHMVVAVGDQILLHRLWEQEE